VAVANLTRAFEEKAPDEVRKLARQNFVQLGANLVSGLKLTSMSQGDISARLTIEIPEEVTARRQSERRGWIAMLSHLGNWEVFTQLGHLLSEYQIGAAYQPLRNRFIDAHFRELRAKAGVRLFDRNSELLGASTFLREGGALGVLVDQRAGDSGLWTPLFGRLASTSMLAATLSHRSGSGIVPIAVYTVGVARWRIVVSNVIERSETIPATVEKMNQCLAVQIRQAPADWLWAHDRWKTPRYQILLSNAPHGIQCSDRSSLKAFRVLAVLPRDDVACNAAQPALKAIKESRPDVSLTVVGSPAQVNAVAPLVDRFVPWGNRRSVFAMARTLGGQDVAYLFASDWRSLVCAALSGTPRRVGYASSWARLLLHQIVRTDNHDTSSESYYLALVRATGGPT
jgi:lauroyl/myristoyl acyltransferase